MPLDPNKTSNPKRLQKTLSETQESPDASFAPLHAASLDFGDASRPLLEFLGFVALATMIDGIYYALALSVGGAAVFELAIAG